MKKIDMSVVNEETLTHLEACEDGKKWFLTNIGSLPVSKIQDIVGGYKGYINWLNLRYVRCTYDEHGNVLVYKGRNGYKENHGYDKDGNHTSYSDTTGVRWIATYDEHGNRITYKDQYDYKEIRTYDDRNNMLTCEVVDGGLTTYTYDENNNLISSVDDAGHVTLYEYDDNGNKTRSIRNDNVIYTKTYDKNNNLLVENYSLGDSTSYTYNDNGDVLTSTSNDYSCVYEYDNFNNRISCKGSDDIEWNKTYDNKGNLLTYTVTSNDKPFIHRGTELLEDTTYTYVNDGNTFTMTKNGKTILTVKL